MIPAAEESVFEVYSAKCPDCGAWEVWDVANPRFVNGPHIPFESCCPVCGNLFRVNALDSGFVTFETREKGFSTVRPNLQAWRLLRLSMLTQEHRRHPRVAVEQIVTLTSSTCIGDKAALTRDISLGGVLLTTNSCVAEGSEVVLFVALPAEIAGKCELRVLCNGRVLRRAERGDRAAIAVEFSEYDLPPRQEKVA